MLPPVEDVNSEDPTSQIPWPSRARPRNNLEPSPAGINEASEDVEHENNPKDPTKPKATKRKLTTWNLITLSISMLGAQIVWTVELGYGTPFLLGLGLTEQLTSLVWLAGPISGLIAQPVIGAISDSSSSKYRRRYWIATSTVVLVISTFVLAYCKEMAAFFVDLLRIGAGDWDERRNRQVDNTAIGLAIVAFYLLDFALNALQASLRNLLLDITPTSQLNSGNAWHGRMTHAGNIIGFGFGFLPLEKLPLIRLLGGTQFRKFCVICIIILVITVWMTCAFHEEEERTNGGSVGPSKFREVLSNIHTAIISLPRPIRRVCYVQFFAFMGWFPFLFYSTTYMGQIMAYELDKEPNPDYATRTGEFAMLLYSIVAVVAGTILPHLANRDRRLMGHKTDVDEEAEIDRLRNTVRQWRAEAAQKGKPLKLPVMPFLLRNIWTGALLLFSLLTFSTLFIQTVAQATVFIALVGICWAVAMWVPFAIIMELLKELSSNSPTVQTRRSNHGRTISSPGLRRALSDENGRGERRPLLRRRSLDEYDTILDETTSAKPLAGGTILGVHNLAIVIPQFVVALVTSVIFRMVDGGNGTATEDESTYYGKNGVAWVLRFGGFCTLIGALLARRVSPTPTEKAMRRRLGEIRVLQQEGP
ncbi:MFS general substrate transporter [Marasmius fiardii PR-910]|nr:MFS general substrate transporter [Marasmius fiardii PR-910]